MSLKNQLDLLLERSKVFGLPEMYLKQACEFLEHREYGLCFGTIVTQLHEFYRPISGEYYNLIIEIANKMGVEEQHYGFMKDLIAKN